MAIVKMNAECIIQTAGQQNFFSMREKDTINKNYRIIEKVRIGLQLLISFKLE